jgi:hypothetical protein
MGIRGRGFTDWPPAKRREEQRRLEKEATKILRSDRARQQQQREAAQKAEPKHEPGPERNGGWVNLSDLKAALRKKERRICVR